MTHQNIENRLVRYDELIPCKNAFIDTRSPGSDKKENFTIIGPGVSENPDQHIHISIPHGFNIGGARQPKGCLNSQHSHLTEEVFIIHSGTWAFLSGVDANDGKVILEPGDIISLPTDIFRGFENIGEGTAYLFAILGSDDPGRVTWTPQVFDMAKDYGLVLLENGALVDTNLGQTIPKGISPMPVTSPEQIKQHRILDSEQMLSIVQKKEQFNWQSNTALSSFSGVEEAPLIGAVCLNEGLEAGKIDWPHGFVIRAIKILAKTMIPPHRRFEEEVIFVQQGGLKIAVDDQSITIGKGDTFTTPINSVRSFSNDTDSDLIFYVIRRSDEPVAPEFL